MPMTMESALNLVGSAHAKNRLAHAILITGPKGSGKAELAAEILAMLSGTEDGGTDLWGEEIAPEKKPLDEWQGEFVRIIRPQSKSRRILIEEVRELEKPLYLAAPEGTWKVGVVVDAERMNESAANAFLKTLEEPPPASLLLLLTTNPERLLPTILSRCVELSLLEKKAFAGLEEGQLKKLGRLLAQLGRGGPSLQTALALKACFEGLIKESKDVLEAKSQAELKAEIEQYRQASDGKWLEKREEQAKAALAGELLEVRGVLAGCLSAWMGDALRQRLNAGLVQLDELGESSAAFGDSLEIASLLERCEALRKMEANLETNASEALVLEVGFLNAFA
ncbi:MAG: hypothetical protein AAGC74_01300 [Verrucomicrobiota bacterium]